MVRCHYLITKNNQNQIDYFFISVTLYHKKHILMVGDTMTKVDNFKEFVKKIKY